MLSTAKLLALFIADSILTSASDALNLTAARSARWDTCRFNPPVNADQERLSFREFFWFHVPKTGLDFERHIRAAAGYPLELKTGLGDWNKGHRGLPLKQIGCLTIPSLPGPIPMPRCGNAVGFFRAPDQRFISAYYHTPRKFTFFNTKAIAAHDEMLEKGWGLGRRLEGMLNVSGCDINGVQTKMLLGYHSGHVSRVTKAGDEVMLAGIAGPCEYLNPRLIAKAVLNLETRFPFVGLTSDWFSSLCLFRTLVGDTSSHDKTHVHAGGAHRAAINHMESHAKSKLFDKYARENPRCEGLSEENEKLCAIGSVDESGRVTYRTTDLAPGFVDCADEITYAAAANRRWDLARRAAEAGAVLLQELLEKPTRTLPEACKALNGEVEAALRLIGARSGGLS